MVFFRFLKILLPCLLAAVPSVLGAQSARPDGSLSEEFRSDYERQVRNVGAAGVGVETIVNRWLEACPDDPEAYEARFNFLLAKSGSTQIVQKDRLRYLGQKPVLTLKDSLGRNVNYFEEVSYDDSLFADALKAARRAVELSPYELRYRYDMISALISYEKESPDMGAAEIFSLIDEFEAGQDLRWTLDSEVLESSPGAPDYRFSQAMGEFCYLFFHLGSDQGYGYFHDISERMNEIDPKNPVFLDNMGSYWQVAERNDRKAARYYKKALRLDPEDYAARTNLELIQSSRSKQGRGSR